jgi:hypothetical protein
MVFILGTKGQQSLSQADYASSSLRINSSQLLTLPLAKPVANHSR